MWVFRAVGGMFGVCDCVRKGLGLIDGNVNISQEAHLAGLLCSV